MDALPEELLAAICEQCDHASLKSLRLVQKRLSAGSTAAVFEHFFMGLFEYGLNNLVNLSNSPALSKHVKRFTIYSDILPAWNAGDFFEAIDYRPSFSSWYALEALGQSHGQSHFQRTITTRHDRRDYSSEYEALPRHDFSSAELERARNTFLNILAGQRNWRQEQHGTRMKEALTSLPNLVHASVKSTAPFAGTNDWPVWKALRAAIRVGPNDWRYSTDQFDAEYASSSGYAGLALTEAVGYRASFHGMKPVSELHVQSSHIGSLEDLTNHHPGRHVLHQGISQAQQPALSQFDLSSTGHQLRVDAFRTLVVLRLHIPYATLSTRYTGLNLQHETISFLKATALLRDLDLRYTDDELSPDDEMPQLESLFSQGVIWPRLERLVLATNLSAEVLLGFLSQHSVTLRKLELRDMLVSGVQRALDQLPSVVSLQHVYAECLWDYSPEGEFLSVLSQGTDYPEPYERDVKAYLLGTSNSMPTLAWDGARGSQVGLYDHEDLVLPLFDDEEMSDASGV